MVEITPSISQELARFRAGMVSELRYEIAFAIPASVHEPVLGTETVYLRLANAYRPLVLDFAQPAERVRSVRVNGKDADFALTNDHLVLPPRFLRSGPNEIFVEFIAGDAPLNRKADYLYTLFVPSRASEVFPCLDQPDLKARFRLTLRTPVSWRAVANGPLIERAVSNDHATYRFAETKPISTYLFAFAAGRFALETSERNGRRMTMYHRESDAEKVSRNRKALFDLHGNALSWLERYTGIAYPFAKLDFVLLPALQYRGMEHPGGIFYRSNSLLLDESATQKQVLARASVIAHETAHMWFGNLVTMRWFDDVWTKEVFANFLADKMVAAWFGQIDHDLRFLLTHYPAAYAIDRTRGTHAIRQPLSNLREADSLYGPIIYHKAPIMMRQLESLIGEVTLQGALRTYLARNGFGTAGWPDLVGILNKFSATDIKTWSRIWVEEPGRPRIHAESEQTPTGRIAKLSLVQEDPDGRGRVWAQRLALLLGYPERWLRLPVRMDREHAGVAAAVGQPAPAFVLPGYGIGYGHFALDAESRAYLLRHLPKLSDPIARVSAWIALWEAMLHGKTSPDALIELAMRALPQENEELIIQRVLTYLKGAYWRFLRPESRTALAPGLEALCWRLLDQAPTRSLRAAYFNAYRSIALTEPGLERLRALWQRKRTLPTLTFSEEDYIRMSQALALRSPSEAARILERQQSRITNPDRAARFAFVRPALAADPAVHDSFFARLKDPRNRRPEPWVIEALRYLHHPLRAEASEAYILPSLELLEEVQRTGDIFFTKQWLDATLSGYQSAAAANTVRRFLDTRPDYPRHLRLKILQSADALFRAAEIVR